MIDLQPLSEQQLGRRPQADSFSIEDLLHDVEAGRIRIPRFQRGLKWLDSDRVLLFDSIYRGYPIGTLLLWKKAAPAARVQIGRWVTNLPARQDALWLVDGQQRTAALIDAALVDKAPPAERALRFDLEERVFGYGTAKQKGPPRWIPVAEVMDSTRLLRWAAGQQLVEQGLLEPALEVGKRLREYKMPAYVIETEDERVLRRIFDRTNQTGKRMTESEVFDALHGEQGAEQPSSLGGIAEAQSLRASGFGPIPTELILHALIAILGKNPGRGSKQFEIGDTPALRETADALGHVVHFLQQAGFPNIALLPYSFPIAGLARFFHFHPEPNDRSQLLLTRWLWRGAINSEHAGGTSALRRMIAAVDERDEEGSVQALLATVRQRPAAPFDLDGFDRKTARTRLQLAALAARQPRDLGTGEILDLSAICGQKGAAAVRLASSSHARLPHANGLAGRLLHPFAPPAQLRASIQSSEDESVLASHLISPEAQAALREDDFGVFLELRHRDLKEHVSGFLDQKADWEPSDRDRPSLGYLTAESA